MKNLLLLSLLLPCFLLCQPNIKNLNRNSTEVFAYKITAATAEQYILRDSIPVDNFLSQQPAYIFKYRNVDEDILPKGHYVLFSVSENHIVASITAISDLLVYPVNNRYNIQLEVRTLEGATINNAALWLGKKRIKYDESSKTYLLHRKKLEAGLVKICTASDTTFVSIESNDDYSKPVLAQRWLNFKASKTGRIITWLPRKITNLASNKHYYKQAKKGSGYVLFNQPKYKPTDTVKLKAFIVTSKWKPYTKKAGIYLSYYAYGKLNEKLLATVDPASAGSYPYSFPLNDSFPADIKYHVIFKNEKNDVLLSGVFNIDDYLLDDISTYKLRTEKENYYPGDSMRFYTAAKDANGLALLDATATLVLTTNTIEHFYRDTMYVNDTIYRQEKQLITEGETVFTLSTDQLPDAQLLLTAKVIFKNSNNETQEETTKVSFMPKAKQLIVTVDRDSVFANYLVNGRSTNATGEVDISGDLIYQTKTINYPARIKIDPLADEYDFTLYAGKDTLNETADIESRYSPSLIRISKGDTLGFTLLNPYRIPVNYIVLIGDKLAGSGKSDDETITWTKTAASKTKIYTVKWQYNWAGEHREGSENLALLYKLLDVKIDHAATVYPGQRDSITINVSDYKNRPAQGVNLSAVAYNSQFKKDINVHEPPYLVKYKRKAGISRQTHETDDPYPLLKYQLGHHQQWIKKFGLDTMVFYKMLFPDQYPFDVTTQISEFIPQLSVQVLKQGQPQEVCLLYVNRQLVYYSGVTDKMQYAFETMQGYTQVGIRLRDKYIEIDSLYMQPFYKHDLFIDLDSLPKHTIVNERPKYYTDAERNILEKSIWQLDNIAHTNNGFVWQYNHLAVLSNNTEHLVGPFSANDSLHYFAPGKFDIHFKFEPGYQYNLSQKILRLEKSSLFPKDTAWIPKSKFETTNMVLGDTIIPPPITNYNVKFNYEPFIAERYGNENSTANEINGRGQLKFSVAGDSVLKYVILYSKDSSKGHIVNRQNIRLVNSIPKGIYTLLLVDRRFNAIQIDSINIQRNQTFCINTTGYSFNKNNRLLDELIESSRPKPIKAAVANNKETIPEPALNLPAYAPGNSFIMGKVIDAKGKEPIPGASINIKGTKGGAATDRNGNFAIKNIKEGNYTLLIASVGYNTREVKVSVAYADSTNLSVELNMSTKNLNEVVVIGYGTSTKRSLTGSVSVVNGMELTSTISGRVAGVFVTSAPGGNDRIMIRGIGSINGNSKPIYVVDGIIYDELPASLKPEMINTTEVLTDAAATALYGSRAVNGVVVITTGTKSLRNTFRDYAFWQPELITDANGKVSFEVVYPDNITGWQLYALAMDKHLRMGKGTAFTNAYKPISAQLSTPQFLIENDTAQVIGKALNYTSDEYGYTTKLSVNNKLIHTTDGVLLPKASAITAAAVTARSADTLVANFSLQTISGFKDGEDRKIPVFKQGTEEATGSFMVLEHDTTFSFTPMQGGAPVQVYIQNNTLDILLNELDRLKKYPFYCMEQTASKLKGLKMEQDIRRQLKQPFTNEKELNLLLKKLQQNQLFDGGWSWWEKGQANLDITCYIVETLLRFRSGNALVESNIRNGLLYLQNQLPAAGRTTRLQILSTLANAGHAIDYQPFMEKIPFDSLTQHQQWQWINICQRQKLSYAKQLDTLVSRRNNGMLGSVNWGAENYRWNSNEIATTILAYKALENEQNYQYLLPGILQYLLTQKKGGYWRNTVESASVISVILPRLLQSNAGFTSEASVTISGSTSVSINKFAWAGTVPAADTTPVTITKTGGGVTYLTLYQEWWNNSPLAVKNNFDIETYFERNGQKMMQIEAGEKIKMTATINVKKEVEYVMIEIPIPAGCNYASTKQVNGMHREYYKNKILVFAEKLPVGICSFEIELEPRYKGNFTLNPAKALLMYFPTFFGRNEIRKVMIK